MRASPFLALALLASVSCSSSNNVPVTAQLNTNAPNTTPQATPDPNVLFTIPVGENGIQYANEDAVELEPWGPSSFTITPDGTYLIVDTVGNRILRFDRDGNQLSPIVLENVGGITDVTATADKIYALDQAAPNPALYRLSNEGQVEERIDLMRAGRTRSRPEIESLKGIGTTQDNSVFLEFNTAAPARDLNNAPAFDSALRGDRFSVRVPSLQAQVQEGGRATVLRNGQPFTEIRVDNMVTEVSVLAVNSAGDVFIVVDEIIPTALVTIDQTVRRYRSDGTFIDMARVPLAEMYVAWKETVKFNPATGAVVAIITRRGQPAVVRRLAFTAQLDPILPRTSFTPSAASSGTAPNCRPRSQMIETARLYYNNRTQLSAGNLEGDCTGRRKPRYLRAAGEYTSVPYDWGGFDTVAEFRNAMTAGMQAGDVQTCRTGNCIEPCSKGVDCSGFVCRAWNSGRNTTTSLPNISNEIKIVELRPGDILNRPNNHVVLFEKFGDDPQRNGPWLYEATTSENLDRVVNRQVGWRKLIGYTARRYRRVCGG